eukprot:gene10904-biopygen19840
MASLSRLRALPLPDPFPPRAQSSPEQEHLIALLGVRKRANPSDTCVFKDGAGDFSECGIPPRTLGDVSDAAVMSCGQHEPSSLAHWEFPPRTHDSATPPALVVNVVAARTPRNIMNHCHVASSALAALPRLLQ